MRQEPQCFLSYAREDVLAATRLRDALTHMGIHVWFDRDSIRPGEDWRHAISDGIRSSKFFIALLSTTSVNKQGVVQREVREALDQMLERPEGKVYIIPTRLEQVEPSYPALHRIQWLDLFPDWNRAILRLVDAMSISADDAVAKGKSLRLGELPELILSVAEECEVDVVTNTRELVPSRTCGIPRDILRITLADLFLNVRMHGLREQDGTSAANVNLIPMNQSIGIQVENKVQRDFRPVSRSFRGPLEASLLGEFDASLAFETQDCKYRATLTMPTFE